MTHALDWSRIDTVLCDMDGTLLDLGFDHFFWQEEVPRQWGLQRGLDLAAAQLALAPLFARHRGTLDWYCLDFWARTLELDLRQLKQAHAEQICFLPGVVTILDTLRAAGLHLVLVTNAHPHTLAIKAERTGVLAHFDAAHSTHAFGAPKEQPVFWSRFSRATGLDLQRAILVDDTDAVLEGAIAGGVGQVLALRQPSSRHPARPPGGRFPELFSLAELRVPEDLGLTGTGSSPA